MKKIHPFLWSLFAAGVTLAVCLHYYSPDGALGGSRIAAWKSALKVRLRQASIHPEADPDQSGPEETEDDELARQRWELQRHGFNLGVPKDAYAKAMNQRLRMEVVSKAAIAARGLAAVGPNWEFIGPMPMARQQANFTGLPLYGPIFNAAGRISAIAVDPTTDFIYVGAASGGVWLSKDSGSTFTWISKDLPTQSIGSIAIDITNTTPPTVYVGTGEGNSSGADTFYGLGLWATQDEGKDWTSVDASEFSGNGAYQTFTSLDMPCDTIFAGTGNGLSSSRGISTIDECEPGIFSTPFNCMQGAIYEGIPPTPGADWHRIFGEPNSQDPNGGPVRTLAIGAIIDSQTFAEIPAMFAAIDGLGLVSTEDSTGLPFTCGNPSLSPFDVAGRFNSVLAAAPGRPLWALQRGYRQPRCHGYRQPRSRSPSLRLGRVLR
jgi:hypothetical protein